MTDTAELALEDIPNRRIHASSIKLYRPQRASVALNPSQASSPIPRLLRYLCFRLLWRSALVALVFCGFIAVLAAMSPLR